MRDIPLKRGKSANYMSTRHTIIKEIDETKPTAVHIYGVPCPVCTHRNPAYSYDGRVFVASQITCRDCGVFYRPIIDPQSLQSETLAVNQMNKAKPEAPPAQKSWNGPDDAEDKW